MKREKYLKHELLSTSSFLLLIEAYEEISSIRMRKVKKSVLSRRDFMQGLNDAFAYIVYAYKLYKQSLKDKGTGKILNTNNKTVSVFLASNTGLYGDIIRNTYQVFANDVKDSDTDIVIAGRLGMKYYESSNIGKPCTYFDISDNGTDDASIKKMLDFLITYSDVIIYHGVFKSILKQEAVKTQLTGEVMKIEESLKDRNAGFIFEPTIEKIAEYFEKQILSLLFEQTVFESSLSKFASRMVSLDSAAENINQRLSFLDFEYKKAKHKRINSGMHTTISGESLWK